MSEQSLQAVNRYCQSLAKPSTRDLPDRELLEIFARTRDEAAFSLLVDRHGSLVRGVCLRVLQDNDQADDVFQAVFIVLSQKAGSLKRGELLANWLFGVARRLALRAKRECARRRRREERSADVRPEALSPRGWDDLLVVLEEELQRLPARFRAPLLACYYRGRTQDEAARELGWNVRTLRRRLVKGREILRRRMERRGATLTAGLFATALVPSAVDAGLPSALRASALTAVGNGTFSATVSELVRGGLRMLALSRIRRQASIALILAAVVTIGGLGWRGIASSAGAVQVEARNATNDQPASMDDRLPEGALLRLGDLRFRHGGPLSQPVLVFASDDRTLLSGGDRFVRQWQVADGVEKNDFAVDPSQRPAATVFSTDGKTAFQIAGDEKSMHVHVFDAVAWKEVRDIELTPPPTQIDETEINWKGPTGGVGNRLFELAPNASVIGGITPSGRLAIWDATTGKHLRTMEVPGTGTTQRQIKAFMFSPNGTDVIAWGSNPNIQVWDFKTGAGEQIDLNPAHQAFSVQGTRPIPWAISPDGKTLAIGIWTHTDLPRAGGRGISIGNRVPPRLPPGIPLVRLIALRSGGKSGDLAGFDGSDDVFWFHRLLFAQDGRSIFYCASGKTSEWGSMALDGAKPMRVPTGSDYSPTALALSHDRRTIATCSSDGVIRLWDAITGKEHPLSGLNLASVAAVVFDGDSIITAARDGAIRTWDCRTGRLQSTRSLAEPELDRLTLSPNGRWLVQWHNPLPRDAETGASVIVNDVKTGDVYYRVNMPADWDFQFTPGDTLIIFEQDGTLREWNLTTGKKERVEATAAPGLHRMSASSAVVTIDRACTGTDRRTGRELFHWPLPNDMLPEPSRLPEGMRVQESRVPSERKRVLDAAISPDNKLIAFFTWNFNPTTRRIVLCELQTGKTVNEIDLKTDWVSNLTFSPDAKTLVSVSSQAHCWDVATGRSIRLLDSHRGPIQAVAFNRDGTRLATAGVDGTVMIWDSSR